MNYTKFILVMFIQIAFIVVGIFEGADLIKKLMFRTYLASVGLPTKENYNGGTYSHWKDTRLTYKIDDISAVYANMCKPYSSPYMDKPIAEIEKMADTDPDAMFQMYRLLINSSAAGDNITAMHYLQKAAAMGHIVANIELTDYSDNLTEKEAVLEAYSKITPYAESKRLGTLIKNSDVKRLSEIIQKLDEFPWLIGQIFNRAGPTLYAQLPGYEDYWCEARFRGCQVPNLKIQCAK